MRFESVPVSQAAGAVLGHNVAGADGRRLLRKGTVLDAAHCAALAAAGRATVWVARLEADDVDEDTAATRIARAVIGASEADAGDSSASGVGATRARTGRVNLMARHAGVVRIDTARLTALNRHPGVTLATLRNHEAVDAGKMIATLKIIPYALAESTVASAQSCAHGDRALIEVAGPVVSRVGLVLSGSPGTRAPIELGFRTALDARLSPFGAAIESVRFVDLDRDDGVARLADAVRELRDLGTELIILAGETAIMDRHDIAPRAIETVGGEVIVFGAPVDPGNLLMLAALGDVPVLGAPGCARSPKTNVVDRVLPRLLIGDRLTRDDLIDLAHGGLLEDVPERRMPRSWVT